MEQKTLGHFVHWRDARREAYVDRYCVDDSATTVAIQR